MPRINLSQYQFVLSDPYQPGHVMTELEASTLNYHRADLIRKIVIRWVNDAEDAAPDGVLTVEALEALTDAISQLDEQYQLSERSEPKLPAFNHVLREVALESMSGHTPEQPNFEFRVGIAMLDKTVRRKARQRLVDSIRSVYGPSNNY
jgi:hypothetical protein